MKTLLILLLTFGISFSANAKIFQVDFTVTSSEGCTFHIVGEVDMNIAIPLANSTVNGFVGTITVGGASGCPRGTFNVSFGLVSGGNPDPDTFTPAEKEILNQVLWEDPDMQNAIEGL